MFDSTEWEIDNTALKNISGYSKTQAEELCSKLDFQINSINFESGVLTIFPSDVKKVFFLEEYFIKGSTKFRQVLERFAVKNFDLGFQYFSQKDHSLINIDNEYQFGDIEHYKELVNNNILDNDGIRQENLYLSPYIFDTLLKLIKKYESDEYYEKHKDVLRYMRELFSLIAISEKTIYKNIQGHQSFIFQFFHESHGIIKKTVQWQEWSKLASSNFFFLYEWLIKNIESTPSSNSYSRNINLVKAIVQDYIRNRGKIEVKKNSTIELDSILSRIRTGQTEKYFEQQNKLKDELIMLNQNEMESKNRIRSRLLGTLTTVSIGYYSQFLIEDQGIVNSGNLLDPNITLSVIFFLSAIAIIFFIVSLLMEIHERRNYYDRIEIVYVDYLFFDKEDFNSKLQKPHYWKDYRIYWIILGFFLIICLILMYYYYPQ